MADSSPPPPDPDESRVLTYGMFKRLLDHVSGLSDMKLDDSYIEQMFRHYDDFDTAFNQRAENPPEPENVSVTFIMGVFQKTFSWIGSRLDRTLAWLGDNIGKLLLKVAVPVVVVVAGIYLFKTEGPIDMEFQGIKIKGCTELKEKHKNLVESHTKTLGMYSELKKNCSLIPPNPDLPEISG